MKNVSQAVDVFMGVQRVNAGEKTIKNYSLFLAKFVSQFGKFDLRTISSEDILSFLVQSTEGQKQSTKRLKYTLLKSFFNFLSTSIDENISNPCNTKVLRKMFRLPTGRLWTILEKDVVDEIIFRTNNVRNRLMLELMARGGMRIGEVLKLRAKDVDDRKLLITKPKSGREYEVVYIPKKVAERLRDYVRIMKLEQDQAVFPIGYSGARAAVKKAGLIVGIDLNPHDLRRHAATFASTAGHLYYLSMGHAKKTSTSFIWVIFRTVQRLVSHFPRLHVKSRGLT